MAPTRVTPLDRKIQGTDKKNYQIQIVALYACGSTNTTDLKTKQNTPVSYYAVIQATIVQVIKEDYPLPDNLQKTKRALPNFIRFKSNFTPAILM